jgi:ribonuclease T1
VNAAPVESIAFSAFWKLCVSFPRFFNPRFASRLALAWCLAISAALGLGTDLVRAKGVPEASKLPTVALADLPKQGQETHALILQGGPFPYDKDGTVFGNRERLLPIEKRGFYREYTVKTPFKRNRGERRIVCGGEKPKTPDVCYYTADHYSSFQRIVSK